MRRWIGPLAVFIITAVGAHWATLAYAPNVIMDRALSTLKNRGISEHALTTPQRMRGRLDMDRRELLVHLLLEFLSLFVYLTRCKAAPPHFGLLPIAEAHRVPAAVVIGEYLPDLVAQPEVARRRSHHDHPSPCSTCLELVLP